MGISEDIVRRGSVEQLIGHRDRAIDLYTRAAAMLADAKAAHVLACGGNPYVDTAFLRESQYSLPQGDKMRTTAATAIDRDVWRHIMKATNLGSLMDAEAKKQFEDDLTKNPPACTVDNIRATVEGMLGNADGIFRRGLVNAFRTLSREHKSNDGFKIGKRAIWHSGVTYRDGLGFYLNHYREDEIRDVERCFHVLDNKPTPTHQEGIAATMRTIMRDSKDTNEATTDYMMARWHKNGTVHLTFARPDLVTRVNRLIAEHYGAALGAAP